MKRHNRLAYQTSTGCLSATDGGVIDLGRDSSYGNLRKIVFQSHILDNSMDILFVSTLLGC